MRAEKQQDESSVSAESLTAASDWASELARQLIASKSPPPESLDDAQRLALAWALKDAVYAAWSSTPSDVAIAAEVLASMRGSATEGSTSPLGAEVQAIAAWVTGIANLTRGKMTDAITQLDEATHRFRALGQQAHAAHAQVPKIMALSMLGRHDEATASGAETLRELVELGELQAAGKVSLNLSNLQCRIGEYENAFRNYRQAAALFAEVGDPQWSVMSEIGTADAYTLLGRFDDAIATYSRARERAQRHELPVLEAMAEESSSLVNLARGQYGTAFSGLEHARQCYESLGLPQHLATAEKQLADAYLDVRLLPEALALFDRALPRFESLEMPVERAWALAQRGRTLAALMRPQEEVADCLRQAWHLFDAQDVSGGRATVLLARAELALSQNDPESALIFAGEAVASFDSSSLAIGHAQAEVVQANALLQCLDLDAAAALFARTLERARELQLLSIDVRCQVGLGLVARARGEVDAARLAFDSAIAASEEQRNVLPGDDLRSAFLVDQLRPYEEALRIALDAADHTPPSDAATQVLARLEQFRARVLGERLGGTRRHGSASPLDDPDKDLRARVSWLYRRRQKLIDEGENLQPLMIEIRQVEHDLLELARRRRLTGDANMLFGDAVAFDPTALQMALADGESLVEYGVIDDELFACVVTRERVALQRRIARWPEVVEAIHAARFQIETLRYGAGAVDHHLELLSRRSMAAMRRVHDLVWAPIRPLLNGYTKAIVVAHDQLGSLQFAALYDGETYLAQTMNLAMAPSARIALYGMAHQPVTATRALVLGESSRLVHAAEEANFVAGLFDEANVLIGIDANAASLRASCADADVLHLACHAEFRSDNPMFSALQLADGPFTVQDAETLRLRQGIVVLSACETGVAVYSRGDEMIGLVRAFLLAGSSRVVASLWPVDDAVTLRFMAAFYRSLRAGNGPSVALRTAQLDVMKTHPHPFHWAAFTLYGGW